MVGPRPQGIVAAKKEDTEFERLTNKEKQSEDENISRLRSRSPNFRVEEVHR